MKGFRDFIMRGNVIELAVAVIIGTAFTAIVNAIVAGLFNPLIAALFDTGEIADAVWQVGAVSFGVGQVIAAIINFLLVAAVLYFAIILPVNKFNDSLYVRLHGHHKSEEPVPATETDLLVEIRDLLQAQQTAPPTVGSTTPTETSGPKHAEE